MLSTAEREKEEERGNSRGSDRQFLKWGVWLSKIPQKVCTEVKEESEQEKHREKKQKKGKARFGKLWEKVSTDRFRHKKRETYTWEKGFG